MGSAGQPLTVAIKKAKVIVAFLAFPDELAKNVGDAFVSSKAVFLRNFQRKQLNFPASGPVQGRGGGLRKPTGSLSRSFDALVERGDLESVALKVWSAGVKYAAIHEFGGTINHPGGTRYINGPGGKAIFVSNDFVGPVKGKTKPHPIKIIPRLGFFDAWNAHIDKDLMPRMEKAVAKTIKQGGLGG